MTQIQTANCCSRMQNRCVDRIYQNLYESDIPLTMGYVPDQHWESPYDPGKGLRAGTIFPSLCKPFCGKGGACR